MAKNLILCCDGTNNQFAGDHTNVLRTYKVAPQTAKQTTFYNPGVGTMPAPWFTTRIGKRWAMIKGLAFGDGFFGDIEDPYKFLMSRYEPEDKLFIFGFSRGAFAARALAGLLHSTGLLLPGTENLIPYALQYWQRDFGPGSVGGRLCAEFKSTLGRPCPIHFIGIWDTVGSVGFINHFRTFPFTFHNPSVGHIRHAVSIDERRSCFRQNLMEPGFDGQDVRNVWFAGVHSDIGGGYPAAAAGLAKLAFEWMMREASQCGLEIDQAAYQRELALGTAPDPTARVHNSLTGCWWLVELIPERRYSFVDKKRHWHFFKWNQPRDVRAHAAEKWVSVHSSVLERFDRCGDYRPLNLPANVAEITKQFQIER